MNRAFVVDTVLPCACAGTMVALLAACVTHETPSREAQQGQSAKGAGSEAVGCAAPDELDATRGGVDLRTACVTGVAALEHGLDFLSFALVYDDVGGWYWTFDQKLVPAGGGYALRVGPYAHAFLPAGDGLFLPTPADGTRLVTAPDDTLVFLRGDERRTFRRSGPAEHALARVEKLGGADADQPATVAAIALERGLDGQVRSLTDAAGRAVAFDVAGGEPVGLSGPTAVEAWAISTTPTAPGERVRVVERAGPNGPPIRHVFTERGGKLARITFPDGTQAAFDRQLQGGQVRRVRTLDAVGTTRSAVNVLACDTLALRTVFTGDPGGPPGRPYVSQYAYALAGGQPRPQMTRLVSPGGRWLSYDWTGTGGTLLAGVTSSGGDGLRFAYHPDTRVPSRVTLVPGGRVVFQSWDLTPSTLLPRGTIGPDQRTVRARYDALGRLVASAVGTESLRITRTPAADGGTRTCVLFSNTATGVQDRDGGCVDEDARGHLVATRWGGATTAFERHATSGLVTAVNAPGGDRAAYTYDGDLLVSASETARDTMARSHGGAFLRGESDTVSTTTYGYTDYGTLQSAEVVLAGVRWSASTRWTPDRMGADFVANGTTVHRWRVVPDPEPPPLTCRSTL